MRKLTSHEKATLANILEDMLKDNNLLLGVYDAKNGNEHFMYGIMTVMEMLFDLIDKNFTYEYTKAFIENMIASEDLAGVVNE